VSNAKKDCMRLLPLSLACVSDDVHLKLSDMTKTLDGKDKLESGYEEWTERGGRNSGKHVPQIEGYIIMTQHKPVVFAIHLYEYPNDKNTTVIEFQRRQGDSFVFQSFYDKCLEQLT